jgi:hypothetical protein
MKFVEIKVCELESFVGSDSFRQMTELPISTLRAHSQSLNPSADQNDTALIYAMNKQNMVVGYIGILPARAYSTEISKIYFITCWWVDPEAGRGVGMKLFFRMLELTQRKVFFFHLPEKMAAILKAMDNYTFPPVINGFKGFIRLDMKNWLIHRNPRLTFLKSLLLISDAVLNFPVALHLLVSKIQLKKLLGSTSEIILMPGEKELKFITEINKGKTIFRGIEELKWVMTNPWLSTASASQKKEAGKYRFSLLVKEWQQYWVKFSEGDIIKGIAYLTIRDGVASIPYSWFNSKDYAEISKGIAAEFIRMKVSAIQIYNPQLVKGFNEISNLFMHKRLLKRIIAWPAEMDSLMEKEYMLQDGDGDAVFT